MESIKDETSNINGSQTLSFNEPLKTALKSRTGKPVKKVKEPIPRYNESPNQLNAWYAEGEFDLLSIFKLLTQEAYFNNAINKKISQLIKAGFSIHSDDDKIKEYLDARFLMMEMQTGNSISDIITKIATYLAVCSNAFLIKVRDPEFGHAKSYIIDGKDQHPIVGLFIGHPCFIKPRFKWVKFRDSGMVKHKLTLIKWVYVNRRGVIVEFDPEDVIHFTLHKDEGNIFGTPEVLPVIDDIRTLRKIEEDAQLLIYRDLFPLIHYSVENPEMVDHGSGLSELDQAKKDMEKMMQDGGIATDKRHDIKFVGNEGKGIDPSEYLTYFQSRVFAGLGVSATDMGMGQGVSGGTATTLSNQLIDSVKYLQIELARQFKETILLEMALQSPFGIEVLKEGNRPVLKFEEIDLEWKIRKENHLVDQFAKNALTIDEVRNEMGKDTMHDGLKERTHAHMYGDLNPTKLAHGAKPIKPGEKQPKIKELKAVSPGSGSKVPHSSATKDLIKASKSNSNIVKSHRDNSDFIIGDANNIRSSFYECINEITATSKTPIGYKFNMKLATKIIYDHIKVTVKEQFYSGITDAIVKISETKSREEINILSRETERECLSFLYNQIDTINDSLITKILNDSTYMNKASNRVSSAYVTEQVTAYNLGKSLACKYNGITNLDFIKYNKEASDRPRISIEGDSLVDIIAKVKAEHPNSKSIITF